ncbi:MAG TPA: sigma-70 family RNA polymerase sigma factor [Urbifossiella sp.]|jgi:RNA polymerase sigma-70 factor (ECF subfamily)
MAGSFDTRPSLLMRIRNPADAAAWGEFVRIYTPLVYRHCRRAGLQEADAAEVSQEVFAQVARSASGFAYEPARGRFRDWLGAVVRSRLARFFARSGKTPDLLDGQSLDQHPSAPLDPAWMDDFNAHVLAEALARVRGEFGPEHWQAFESVWRDGRPAAEVAASAGLTIVAVYVLKSRVIRRLREEARLLTDDVPYFDPPL